MATINGSGGGDNLNGTDNDDTINGNAGQDSISGGGGNDSISGGDDRDEISGGAGDDHIGGGSGEDSIEGGDGNDSIDGGNDGDTLQGNAGDDTIKGAAGQDYIEGGSGGDSVSGGEDGDTIHGYNDDDTISGDKGEDRLYGGAGNDNIDGGDDKDTIEGGEGDDTLTGGQSEDTFVIRDGHGNDVITDFSPDHDKIAFDMSEMGFYSDVIARMSEDNGNTIITFDNGDTVTLQGVTNSELSSNNFAYSAGPVCLLEGTLIHTERGEIAIEHLRPDDIIWTKDHGWQAIRLVTFERMTFKHRDDPAKPILIPAGALGDGTPNTNLITSPQHRVLRVMPHTGEEVLVPAVRLIGHNGIRRMRGKKKVHYLNIVMERHSIIQAAGCWVESMLVTSRSLERQTEAARRLLDHCLGMHAARRVEREGVRPRRLKSA